MGLSGGYAGEGMYRLTALGAIETSWQQLYNISCKYILSTYHKND